MPRVDSRLTGYNELTCGTCGIRVGLFVTQHRGARSRALLNVTVVVLPAFDTGHTAVVVPTTDAFQIQVSCGPIPTAPDPSVTPGWLSDLVLTLPHA